MIINRLYKTPEIFQRINVFSPIAPPATRNAVVYNVALFVINSIYSVVNSVAYKLVLHSSFYDLAWWLTAIKTVFDRNIFDLFSRQLPFVFSFYGVSKGASVKLVESRLAVSDFAVKSPNPAMSCPSACKMPGLYYFLVSAIAPTQPSYKPASVFDPSYGYQFPKPSVGQIHQSNHFLSLKGRLRSWLVLLSRQYLFQTSETIFEYITNRFYCLDAYIIPQNLMEGSKG